MFMKVFEYMVNNNLQIDKGIYMAAIVGMVTIYGIYLTLYQMVVSCMRDDNLLGINLSQFYIHRHAWWEKKGFGKVTVGTIVLTALTKPFLNIFGKDLERYKIWMPSVICFFWYMIVVFFFVTSAILIFQGVKCVKGLKQREEYVLVRNVEKVFLKGCVSYKEKMASIDSLTEDVEELVMRKEIDNGYRQHKYYIKIFLKIFEKYITKKRKEIKDIQVKGRVCKNQVAFKYNEGVEYEFLRGLILGQYLEADDDLLNCMTKIILDVIELNFQRAKLANEEDVYGSKVLWNSEPYRLVIQIFEQLNVEAKSKMLNLLDEKKKSADDELGELCNECTKDLLQKEFDKAVFGEKEAIDFCDLIPKSRMKDKYNDRIANAIISYIYRYEKEIPLPLIKILSEKNCQYIFMYVFIFYSLNKKKVDWKYIQIDTLRALWKGFDEDNIKLDEVMARLKKCACLEGISDQWGKEFENFIKQHLNSSLIEHVIGKQRFELFYILVLKICVMRQRFYATTGDIAPELQNRIIRELVKHEEVMRDPYMKDFMSYMRINNSYDFNENNLETIDSLRMLLMVNAEIETIFYCKNWDLYKYTKGIGEYFLIKCQNKTKRMKEVNEIIWKAFVTFNGSIEAYIDTLESECRICNYPLNYIQKERMKEYLIEQIRDSG